MKLNRRTFFAPFIVLLALILAGFPLAGSSRGPQRGSRAGVVDATKRVHIVVLGTTDLHGNLFPVDYYTNKADNRGLAKISTLVKQVRKENQNVLLIDSGDTIQGTPLEYYHNKKNNQPPDPMMLAMNALHYDAMTVGNHEYNFGLQVLEKARSEAEFPWLSANTYNKGTNQTHYKPYIVKEVAGVRIGVLGLTTPGIPNWENVPNYAGLEFREPLSEAKKWVPVLRRKERADVVIIAMHMGLEQDLRTGEINPGQVPNENRAIAIAKQVPGVDLIFMGHTASRRAVASYQRCPIDSGKLLGPAPGARGSVFGKRRAALASFARAARTIATDDRVAPDQDILKIGEPYDRETQAWLSRAIGESAAELTAAEARFRDTAILDLIQRVQLEAGKADVSMAAVFNPETRA